jgi:hypothetical protein
MHSSRSRRSRPGARRDRHDWPARELEDEIAHLRDLDLRGLRAGRHSVFRRKAPDHLPRHLLYRMIAYRLQAGRHFDGRGAADVIGSCGGRTASTLRG